MIGGFAHRTRAIASSSVCNELRQQLFPSGSTSYVQIRTATKRGGGSTKNGRDSAGRRLGVKKFGDEYIVPGQIIVRQRGTKFHPGQHVGIGRDHTLFALEPGYLKFYHHHVPFPHLARSELITQNARKVVDPGQIDDGSRELREPLPEKVFPPVRHPRGLKRYIGIVKNKEDSLPRDERSRGRERMFWNKPVGGDEQDDLGLI